MNFSVDQISRMIVVSPKWRTGKWQMEQWHTSTRVLHRDVLDWLLREKEAVVILKDTRKRRPKRSAILEVASPVMEASIKPHNTRMPADESAGIRTTSQTSMVWLSFYFITLATAFTNPGVITDGITSSAVGFLTKLAIFFAAANFMSSVIAFTLRSRAPRKMPGNASELLT